MSSKANSEPSSLRKAASLSCAGLFREDCVTFEVKKLLADMDAALRADLANAGKMLTSRSRAAARKSAEDFLSSRNENECSLILFAPKTEQNSIFGKKI